MVWCGVLLLLLLDGFVFLLFDGEGWLNLEGFVCNEVLGLRWVVEGWRFGFPAWVFVLKEWMWKGWLWGSLGEKISGRIMDLVCCGSFVLDLNGEGEGNGEKSLYD